MCIRDRSYIAQIMYSNDKSKRFRQGLTDGVPIFLAILTFANVKAVSYTHLHCRNDMVVQPRTTVAHHSEIKSIASQ